MHLFRQRNHWKVTIGSYWSIETWTKQWFHCLHHLEIKSIVLWREDQYIYVLEILKKWLIYLYFFCSLLIGSSLVVYVFPESMRNIDLAWKRQVYYALFDKVYQNFFAILLQTWLIWLFQSIFPSLWTPKNLADSTFLIAETSEQMPTCCLFFIYLFFLPWI